MAGQAKRTSKKRYAEIMRDMNLRLDQLIELAAIGAQVKAMDWGSVLHRLDNGSWFYVRDVVGIESTSSGFSAETVTEAIDKAFK